MTVCIPLFCRQVPDVRDPAGCRAGIVADAPEERAAADRPAVAVGRRTRGQLGALGADGQLRSVGPLGDALGSLGESVDAQSVDVHAERAGAERAERLAQRRSGRAVRSAARETGGERGDARALSVAVQRLGALDDHVAQAAPPMTCFLLFLLIQLPMAGLLRVVSPERKLCTSK